MKERFLFESLKLNSLRTFPNLQFLVLVNIADPERAYKLSFLPVSGVGLARIEFIITNQYQSASYGGVCNKVKMRIVPQKAIR